MKLRSIRVQNFRCIDDSGDFDVDEVTCLVGKNESGKTTLLAALEKLNSAVVTRGQFSHLDYPRKRWRPNETIPNEPPAISTKWELSAAEAEAVESNFCVGCLSSRKVLITKSYDNVLNLTADYAERAMVQSILDAVGVAADKLESLKLKDWTLEELAVIEPSATLPEQLRLAIVAEVQAKYPEGLGAVREQLEGFLPKFLYFGEYSKLPGEISLDQFVTRKNAKQMTSDDRLFEALLSLAGTTAEGVSKLPRFEDLNASLRAVSNQISEEIFAYWTQNKYLDFVLRFDSARPQDPAPLNAGFIFRARIDNRRHKSDTNFNERSSGFVWFFSFLVWFSQLKNQYGKRLVILLDEPGLTLHARAQGDLLRYIKERLQPNYQVLYTTHSPFMVDPDNLLSARTVEDVELKDGTLLGTKVGDKVLSTDSDTISPLQRALDYEMTQTLFVGRYTLLVEGPSDLVYLKWASHALQESRGKLLDYRWTICIVGGVDRIAPFASLFKGNGLRIAALVDFASGQKQKITNARKAIGDKMVFSAELYADQPEADIEDVLGREFYIAVVNEAYRLLGPDRLSVPTVKDAPRIVKFVEDRFRTLPSRYGDFDHCRPAEWLMEAGTTASTLKDYSDALDRMLKMITDINAAISSAA